MKYYPDGEFQMYNSFPDAYAAVNEGIIDASTAFIDHRDEIESANPNVAYINEPFMTIGFGFGMQKSEKGNALLAEFNTFLKQYQESGEIDRVFNKWKDPLRDISFSYDEGICRINAELVC